jgi:cob(I)alamin adenosyltransferase
VRGLDPENWLAAELATIQVRLFHAGAELAATRADVLATLERLGEEDVAALERWIDRLEAESAPPTGFVLPGASAQGARLHVARTVCRRAERRVVALQRTEPVGPGPLRYLNRLGDLLFVMARWCDRRDGATGA